MCESWIIKKAESQIIDAFKPWCWRRLLRVPWTARGSNQSILKEISTEYSLKGLMLKLKLQYFGHLMWKTDSLESLEKDPDDGKDWRQKEKGMVEDEMDCWNWANSGRWWRTGKPGVLQAMGSQRVSNLKATRTALTLRRCLINNCWVDV